uniref:Transposase n=1 Tax=Heterorhabditis bacteriophora TaxID=37862 RepID=A0A1I7W8N6_HETBA
MVVSLPVNGRNRALVTILSVDAPFRNRVSRGRFTFMKATADEPDIQIVDIDSEERIIHTIESYVNCSNCSRDGHR